MHTMCIFMNITKKAYTWITLTYKFCSFLRIFSTSWCTLFHTRTVPEISVCCNAQNIIHFYALLVKNTSFGFPHISWLIIYPILCTPSLVWRASSFLRVLSANYCILSIFNYRNCPVLISNFHQWLSPLFYRHFLIFLKNQIKGTNTNQAYAQYLCFWKKSSKATSHSDSHGSPT